MTVTGVITAVWSFVMRDDAPLFEGDKSDSNPVGNSNNDDKFLNNQNFHHQQNSHLTSPASGECQASMPSKDISQVLKGWDYESGTINVRKIDGGDGSCKLQMRLDLGLLQMEVDGRPDGSRPHGCESLLDYFERLLVEHTQRNGTQLGFHLDPEQCQSLRDEAVMYYHRYLSLFVLGEFPGVVRDTRRNLRVLDLCGKFATDEQDRLFLEQYRPYLIMMNARSQASIQCDAGKFPAALQTIDAGLESIREFFARFGQEESFAQSNEVKILKRFALDIRRKLPPDPLRKLQARLDRAIREERYEDAARLRDALIAKKQEPSP